MVENYYQKPLGIHSHLQKLENVRGNFPLRQKKKRKKAPSLLKATN